MTKDFRYAARMLARTPAVTVAAIVSLALGIGANTAIYSLINALLLRPLPVSDPHQLVALSTRGPDTQNFNDGLSVTMFEEIRRNQRVFSDLFAWAGGAMVNLEANGAVSPGVLDTVGGTYFATLGLRPTLGRFIGEEDVALVSGSSARVAVLSYRCWQERYNRRPSVLGETIRVDGLPLTIVGVASGTFSGIMIDAGSDVYVPIGFSGATTFRQRSRLWLEVVARLKRGVRREQAQAHLNGIWPGVLAASAPEEHGGEARAPFFARKIVVEPIAAGTSFMRRLLLRPLAVLMALVGLVLLIACVNLANLMLARAAARRQEIGIRVALGASRSRLIGQLLAESTMLSVAGAALGILVATWLSRLLLNTVWSGYVPTALDIRPDVRVFFFAAAIALLTGVLFGLAPAWRLRIDPGTMLRQETRSVRRGNGAVTKALIGAQVALSLVLVTGAGLFVGSLHKMRSVDPGFKRDGVLMVQLFPRRRQPIPNRVSNYHELADKLSQLPGVEAVSYSHMAPAFRMEFKERLSRSGSTGNAADAIADYVGPGFFHLIGMRVLAGREFDWRDDDRSRRVAIISASLAGRMFPNESPIGRKIDIGSSPDNKGVEIVGVASNASLWRIQSREPAAVFLALMQDPAYNSSSIDIRTSGDPAAIAPGARRVLESLGHHTTLRIATLRDRFDMILANERVLAVLSAFLGGLALLLAGVGLYGLMSYAVTRRTSEIGIRVALGARPGTVQRLVLVEVTRLVLAGVAAGIPLELALSKLIAGMLFGVSGQDITTIASSTAVLLAVALAAAYLPARRAAAIDPMEALRTE